MSDVVKSARCKKGKVLWKAMNQQDTETVCKAGPALFSYKQRGLQAVNQTRANLVRRSTNEPLSPEKEDTTQQTKEWVNAIV